MELRTRNGESHIDWLIIQGSALGPVEYVFKAFHLHPIFPTNLHSRVVCCVSLYKQEVRSESRAFCKCNPASLTYVNPRRQYKQRRGAVAMATGRCDGRAYRVVVGDVQSVVQPVDGQLQASADAAAARLVQHLGAGRGRSSPSTSGPDGSRTPVTAGVDGDAVDSVTWRGEVHELTRPMHCHSCTKTVTISAAELSQAYV